MNKPLRVLHVVVNMHRGGAETLIMNLYRNMDRSKVQFDFLTCKEGVFDSEILAMGGLIHRIPYISEVGHFGYIKALDYFFSSHSHYKVVHSHMDKMSGYVLRSAKKANIPVRIAHSHNTKSEGGIAARTYKWVAGTAINPNANNFFACSEAAANWLFRGSAEKAQIIKNGIEASNFQYSLEVRKQVRSQLHLDDNAFVIGHVGRFNHQKNHSFLLEVFAELLKVKKESILLLAGDGPLRSKIESEIIKLNLKDSVKFLGVRSDINRVLQALDCFVFPSFHEGLPVTLIEAQGAGLPCVVSDAITREVDMEVNLISYLPLKSKLEWVNSFCEISTKKLLRTITTVDALAKKGYEIKNSTEKIQNSYFTLLG